MGPGGTLRMIFEADAWDSTISFAAGIPVTRGGTLQLAFADDVNPASQVGRTFKLFDWTGVAPSGTISLVSSPYTWNLVEALRDRRSDPHRRARTAQRYHRRRRRDQPLWMGSPPGQIVQKSSCRRANSEEQSRGIAE